MKNSVSVRCFTLVELLIVVGIIAVLAGLVLPAVIGGIRQGKITQAKSDLSAIMMALKGVEGTYGKMVKDPYAFGVNNAAHTVSPSSNILHLGDSNTSHSEDAYDAFIAELSVPGNTGLSYRNINARRIKFLEPRASFDPSAAYTSTSSPDNVSQLWRDPWGNRYKILINVTGADNISLTGTSKTLAAKAAGYSFGPNGADNSGCNANLDACITSSDSANHKLHDDVTSWD